MLSLSSSPSSWISQEDTHVNTALTIRCTFSVFSKMILTFSFMQARAAADFSAVTRFLDVAENVIFSGQRMVSSHFFSFPPVVLNCSNSCKDRDKFRIHDELRSTYLFIVETVYSNQPLFCWMMRPQ